MWNTELGFQGGQGLYDFRDGQDGALAAYTGAGVGYGRTGVVNGLATDAPVNDGR